MKRTILPKTISIPKGIILMSAPSKIELVDEWYELTIGIGKDHTARLLIDSDALKTLQNLEPQISIT